MSASSRSDPARRVRVVDSHTEGEPTRVVLDGGPALGDGPLSERRDRFRNSYDAFRRAIVNEPRGSDAMVGALLCAPHHRSSTAGVVFFNNVGYLGMCGHGTIGLVVTLHHLGRLAPGRHTIETPVGAVLTELIGDGKVSFWNVMSYRTRTQVSVDVPGYGPIRGDIAWGGNWFYLVDGSPFELRPGNAGRLTDYCRAVEEALARAGITNGEGGPIDHIELSGPPERPENQSRNFVLCPGGAYDRSPCGTGTSAKLACLEIGRAHV